MTRKKIIYISYLRLGLLALLVAFFSSLLAGILEIITALVQDHFLLLGQKYRKLYLILPWIGISLIYFTTKYFFRGKKNQGIKEIFKTLRFRKDHLPPYKIPSHFLNGFLTVAFGGSTGIEVSTVVATAAIGNTTYRKRTIAAAYKEELICAGVAAGISTLFASPLAGFLFAVEVIARKRSFSLFFSCALAVLVSWFLLPFFGNEDLFDFAVFYWNWSALPYMLGLSVLAGLLAVYFTKAVILTKQVSGKLKDNFIRLSLGSILIGFGIYFFPQLYGDGYHGVIELLTSIQTKDFSFELFYLLVFLVFLKPLAAAVTLAAGGDGGVFAPSIVAGAFLGIFVAVGCNHFFGTELIIANFAIIGSAAVLSAAIHAPLTALFLACSLVDGGFVLFVPIAVSTFLAKYLAKWICSYTVYSYSGKTGTKLQNA